MKKLLSLGLVSILAVSTMVACSNKAPQETPGQTPVVETPAVQTTTEGTLSIVDTASVESVSKASTNTFYVESSFTGEELVTLFAERLGAVSIATTNEDGAPNLATAIPSMTQDGKYLYLSLAPCQTLENLQQRKIAVIESYIYTKEATDKLERNKGARVVVTLEEDETALEEVRGSLVETGIFDAETAQKFIFLKVEKVLPLG
ncbi:MAG: hypothetical protein ACRCST_08880 [Turicibacter sp.]